MHLFIIAGHGAGDPGATGNGYTEAERVRVLAAHIGALGGSNVTIADTSRNWYADNGISKLSIPKDYQIIELHMDSASASARGGHVIINGKYKADQYDNALAKMISGIFPGRSQIVVGRTDLANPKRGRKRLSVPADGVWIHYECHGCQDLQQPDGRYRQGHPSGVRVVGGGYVYVYQDGDCR